MRRPGQLVLLVLGSALSSSSSAQDGGAGSPLCAVGAKIDVASSLPMLPGEPLDLNLRITNPGTSPIQFYRPSEETGSVQLFVSSDTTPTVFKAYQGPQWGMLDSVRFPRTLAPNASYDLPLRVLHQVWREPFVLNTPGSYRVKLTYQDGLACKEPLEIPPFKVNVNAPRGSDLAVWTAIKDCSGCAFFLHTGVARSRQSDQDAVSLLRSLAKQYPKSRYTKFIRKQLDALDENSHQ
jgi:hypothetical protein